ncbi:MAG TPA: hypothetical protein VK923_15245 [Euzebyales bacterium]|nr:hypothetical protein [Euzebyales bacterium]
MTRVPALLAALVDDAGLFPPERLPMDRAMARHRADAASAHPVLTHRFLCAASSLAELRAELADEVLRLGLIVDTGPAGVDAAVRAVRSEPRVRLETVEVALPATDVADAARTHVPALAGVGAPVFVELPRARGWRAALEVVAFAGVGTKVRCGGVHAALFPSAAELATMVRAIVAEGVPWKATAGLHHAVRYRDGRTGFDHHGFLNLLVAVSRAVHGGTQDDVAEALAIDSGPALAAEVRAAGDAVGARSRRSLTAYGSCSTSEPIADLDALGLLDDGSDG